MKGLWIRNVRYNLNVFIATALCSCSAIHPKASKKGVDQTYSEINQRSNYESGKIAEFREAEISLTGTPSQVPLAFFPITTTHSAGLSNLKKLKPEQLEKGLSECLGVGWIKNDRSSAWQAKYDLAFSLNNFVSLSVPLGGVDYISQTKRSEESGQLGVLLSQRMAFEVCSASVEKEFGLENSKRKWIGDLSSTSNPTTSAAEIVTTVQNLFRGCLSRDVTSEESTRMFALIQENYLSEKSLASSLKTFCFSVVSSGEFMFY